MSSSKYADLPDIDTAPDVYETEDIEPLSQVVNGDSSDDDSGMPSRSAKSRVDPNSREELDYSNLMGADEASKKFRRAEHRTARTRAYYAYPPSPTSPSSELEPSTVSRPTPLSQRLRSLQAELVALENEVADPSNPLLLKEREEQNLDPGELIRGLVDVRTRLDKIKKGREGRARLVGTILGEGSEQASTEDRHLVKDHSEPPAATKVQPKTEIQTMVELDQRVGELEQIVGSSNTTLDEASPLPSPLLPLITRLNTQLTLLTQPRHVDSIARRLKLLLSDLERASIAQQQAHKRHPSQTNAPLPPAMHDQLFPLLTRLGPLLPHIPHILTRLRTLSTLHTSATAFQSTLEDLEEEQRKTRSGLLELQRAVETVENSLQENRDVVKNNIAGLEGRVNSLLSRLEDSTREQQTYES
ncbi:hypothetical protein D9613_000582 [Agrocybe pediades]|uniref:Uncharacterized protein n=1 Tax=Agrocybe pediades TaxID=84607 RepID=A0A8H4R253_9AGAR|nr:hypothetical protein D9613_000582 [Agrocybe pediades]KAF9559843.1 hypothetical protein CPC08DRAFT_708472 [Agrocybe pediades]